MKNAANETEVKKATEKERIDRDLEIADIKSLLELPHGRRFIWRYLGIAGVFKLSFTGNSETFFNEGQRNVGLKLLSDVMEARPTAYAQMAEEAEELEKFKNS